MPQHAETNLRTVECHAFDKTGQRLAAVVDLTLSAMCTSPCRQGITSEDPV
jgi:hypothetical protein